ncbi:hypothetical protein [Agromyces sp. Soil535]|uniref:hypothetical protein n=1 Tax=Agromyces sp. Soil535 TaxID=1736390 RepID=UPI000A98EA05|nr:hypothetical protein [Agromyces sp. Soil535]
MSARIQRMTAADVATRASHARAFMAAAELVDALADDAGIESKANLLGSLAVLAGIAASDAICGASLGERAAGENHTDAVVLLKRASPPEDSSSAQLKRLLDAKTTTQYSPILIGDTKAADLLTAAQRLLKTMETRLSA